MSDEVLSADHCYEVALRWRSVTPRHDEVMRWRCVDDGRWISIAFGEGAELGESVVVCNWAGVREQFDSYEAALALAARWRLGAG